jgi:hypothetical protein
MQNFIFANFLIFAIITIAMLVVDDLLLKHQYKNHKDDWIASGRPRGFIFSPEDSSLLTYWSQSFQPLEKRFYWIRDDVEARALYKFLLILKRLLIWYSILFVPLVFVALIIN